MPRGGFDFRRRRDYPGWGARQEWPPVNPVPTDPNIYTYLSPGTIVDPEPCPDPEDPAPTEIPAPFIVTNLGPYGLGSIWALETGYTAPNSAVYPTANQARFYPFSLPETFDVVSIAIHNGTVVSGNVDVGIYSETGTRLVSSGSTAQTGTSVLQQFTLSASLTRGRYFMATACDNTTATFFRAGIGDSQQAQIAGIYIQASAFPLPSSATFAKPTSNFANVMGLSRRALY